VGYGTKPSEETDFCAFRATENFEVTRDYWTEVGLSR